MYGHYFRGILWFIASLCTCETNDVITKLLEKSLSPLQIIFGRFLFSTLTLLPFVLQRMEVLRTRCWRVNFLRGVILFGGMFIWCYGLDISPLNVACLINFTTPMFTLVLAAILLKEKIEKPRIIATLVGFLGVAVVLYHPTDSFSISAASLFLLSAIFFAILDVLNKMLVTKETVLGSLFFTGFFTLLLTIFLMLILNSPSASIQNVFRASALNLWLLVFLGIGANLLLLFILKSFSYIDVSATAPFRYVELILASALGYLFFDEAISLNVIFGAVIIVPSVIYLARYETQKSRNDTTTISTCCH